MMELRSIVALSSEQGRATGPAVLVTLVAVQGSSYRTPGARLLLTADARVAGTISGGCLETDVVRRALWLTRDGAVVERYTMAFDDTAEIPFGLGCGGTIDLLFEPVHTPEGAALLRAMACAVGGEPARVVHYLPGDGKGLRRLILGQHGEIVFASTALSAEKISCGRGLDINRIYEGRFIEQLSPPQRLVIFGAGDDARPLSAMGAAMGWTVVVADGRKHLARAERFPAAHEVVLLDAGSGIALQPADAIVLMTHSFEQDRTLLQKALAAAPRYLGLLGSRHRSSLLVSEAAESLGRTLAECCEQLYAPVGLDLGGDGPEAIALAIVSEIQAVCHGREGKIARLDADEIVRQVAQGGAERYRQPQCSLNISA